MSTLKDLCILLVNIYTPWPPMTFSEFYVGIAVKFKGIKIWVPRTRGGVEYRAASFEVGLWTTAHHAAISLGCSARSASWIEL